jgi:hypothetical protein
MTTLKDIVSTWYPGCENDRSITGFRIRFGGARGPMSKQRYAALKHKGLGPQEISIGNSIIITKEAEEAWVRARLAPTSAEARLVAREAQARSQRARTNALKGKKKSK